MSERTLKTPPLLSVGIIFKNEIRCLERCLRSFQRLREQVPIEIVMADTGATDGSRAVAEKYADVLVDFPWVNDFAAARNAVLDRCSGVWCLMTDSDEWLDADVSELAEFLRRDTGDGPILCRVVQRNYRTRDLDDNYADFMMGRMLRLSAAPRYRGAIHEYPVFQQTPVTLFMLPHTVLHHDGYVDMGTEKGKAKRDRNLTLLREQLAREPEDLRALLQYIESGSQEADFVERLRTAVRLVLEKKPQWDIQGPSILRYGALHANNRELPEREKWTAAMETLFPQSVFTRVDLNYILAIRAGKDGDYAESLRRQDAYLEAFDRIAADPAMLNELAFSALQYGTAYHRRFIEVLRAQNYARLEQPGRAAGALEALDLSALHGDHVHIALDVLHDLRVRCGYDTDPLVRSFWEGITRPEPSADKMEQRKAAFLQTGGIMFSEKPAVAPERLPWTLFLPLEGKCAVGDAAAAMATEDISRLGSLLARQEALASFPAPAVAHALKHGVRLPLPGRALDVEEIDALAGALSLERETLFSLAAGAADEGFDCDWQSLLWARALALTALQTFRWKEPAEEEGDGLALLRAFAAVEQAYLPRCYVDAALADGHTLPPMHRFGRHCVRAFALLDAGDFVGTVRALREALDTCKDMKHAVEFFLDEVRRLERERTMADASPELLRLAEQVRAILAGYPPDDPAVAALKESAAYKKVAYLIEGA